MKIAIISTVGGYSWAGSEEMWKLLALELLQSGHKVAVWANVAITSSEELVEFNRLGGKAFRLEPLNRLTRRTTNIGLLNRYRALTKWKPDLVCISVGAPADPVWQPDLLKLINSLEVPLIMIVQGNAEGLVAGDCQRNLLGPIYTSARLVIFVSQQNANMLERQLAVSLPQATILSNPIRTRLPKPLPWPMQNPNEIRFATVARFELIHKCQDHTLAAFSSSQWRERNWRLSFFGEGPDKRYLQDLIRHYGLSDKVDLCGYVRDFRKIWSNQHFHILNSHSEGLSLALIESLFCGRPALVTRAGGNAELVRDGMEGFISPGMHPEIVAETLERAWVNRGYWEEMGRSGFLRAADWVKDDLGSRLKASVLDKAGHP
jgi:glycosyltransferase involved in cell wall biosynthesis